MSHTTLDNVAAQVRSTDLTEEERCELLADERRRLTMSVLSGRSGALQLDELATAVAEREVTANRVTEDVVERVTVALHHVHLPKLSESGVVDYEPECQRVTP